MSDLTDSRVFDPEWEEGRGRFRNYRGLFLPGVEHVSPIMLHRLEGGEAHVSIPQRWKVHSPTGFEWGYRGSGPADLALNILGLFVHPPEAWRLHQHFKEGVIAQLSRDQSHRIPGAQVIEWIRTRWAREV